MKTQSIVVAAVVCGLVLMVMPSPASADMKELYKPISDAVKRVFREHCSTPAARVAILKDLVRVMHLSVFEGDIKDLYDDVDLDGYLDQVAGCAATNQFLNSFIGVAAWKTPAYFSDKTDAGKVVPRGVLYSVLLDRVTRAIREEPRRLKKLVNHFVSETAEHPEWKQYCGAFEIAKKLTVDNGMKALSKAFDESYIKPNRGRRTIPLNILEACLEDARLGYTPNARAGLAIAFEAPGQPEYRRGTGEGPTIFSKDRKAILYRPPLTRLWNDLYQTWNMAFVSHYPNNVMFWAKLYNPSVACYQDAPAEYLYLRGISLYLHIHYELFRRVDTQKREPDFDWSDHTLSRLWAEHNEYVAQSYQDELVDNKEHADGWYKAGLKRVLSAFSHTTAETLSVLGQYVRDVSAREDADELSDSLMYRLAVSAGSAVADMIKAVFGSWS